MTAPPGRIRASEPTGRRPRLRPLARADTDGLGRHSDAGRCRARPSRRVKRATAADRSQSAARPSTGTRHRLRGPRATPSAAERIAASEAAVGFAKPPVIPAQGEKTNFIAAARRAAQAAAAAPPERQARADRAAFAASGSEKPSRSAQDPCRGRRGASSPSAACISRCACSKTAPSRTTRCRTAARPLRPRRLRSRPRRPQCCRNRIRPELHPHLARWFCRCPAAHPTPRPMHRPWRDGAKAARAPRPRPCRRGNPAHGAGNAATAIGAA